MGWFSDGNKFKEEMGYHIDGVWYPRVTKILDIKSKPALDSFFREMGSYESAEEVKNKSAEEGSLIHETAQKLLTGAAVEIPPEFAAALETLMQFNEERKMEFIPEYIEKQIWSRSHRYAGTVDALCIIDGKFGVLDIKTSPGFYPEYNLQTAAYIQALQEYQMKKALGLTRAVETRWILRINQHSVCKKCGAKLREKGGRSKIRNGRRNAVKPCPEAEHEFNGPEGDIELKEFPYYYRDAKAFLAAKTLWEWENDYWLKQVGYLR
ncbi:MAG: hypothetical protein HY220_01915 [Candidatus Sungbacteria bacterium]|uniref:PD-(D/E)XK endonuclease-like domain-containing protein n=1 Tax=Candidatus Sungiibacteriota bacterium TaxID=2750080 RepID=A0A9D6LTM5_9BACT|nr:hypothetical protein [Candidatus Sungbacteria bacterium]